MSYDPPPVHCCQCLCCQAGTDPLLGQHHQQINLLLSRLTEPQRRWYVAVLSQAPDAPSDRALSAITGLHPNTIRRGRAEVAAGLPDHPPTRQRRSGGGRQLSEKKIRP